MASKAISKAWYKEMCVYQIWCRSFKDGNGDGIGDLAGVREKLPYIKSLGVDAIWFSPLYKSPQADYGYDISDYRDINPEYGTLEEFRQLLDEAHSMGLKVIMDLVVNHTSDQHEWFLESRKGADNPYHDYYFWRKGRAPGKAPNNWLSTFAGPGWSYDEDLDEWFLHIFTPQQPDLNHDNPKVREEVKDIMRYWLDMGVDGFREDVITYISKKDGLPNGFPIPVACGMEHYDFGPNLEKYLTEYRREVLDNYDCVTIGEAPMITPKKALRLIGEGPDKLLDMVIPFDHMSCDGFLINWIPVKFNLKKLKKCYANWQKTLYGKGWNMLYIENHDQPRIVSRYGSELYRAESAKMLAAAYMLQSGTAFVYQGQEIGMTNLHLQSLDEYVDFQTISTTALMKRLLHLSDKTLVKIASKASRDNSRSPVQWTGGKNAGFTTADDAWFRVNPNYPEINVEKDEKDPDSVLNFYKKLIAFRKDNPLVIYGDYKEHYRSNKRMFCYERRYGDERLLVVCSFSDIPVRFNAPEGFDLSDGECVLNNYPDPIIIENGFALKPYETRVYRFRA
ncbi:MAG: alpha-glucosidase [Clostridia bacterium]|nr:alpha-glucosidase [Clostridia bacterium]